MAELQSLAHYGQEVSPSIDPSFSAEGADYWPSTSAGRFPSAAWTVGFVHGDVITAGKSGRKFVRAVRGP